MNRGAIEVHLSVARESGIFKIYVLPELCVVKPSAVREFRIAELHHRKLRLRIVGDLFELCPIEVRRSMELGAIERGLADRRLIEAAPSLENGVLEIGYRCEACLLELNGTAECGSTEVGISSEFRSAEVDLGGEVNISEVGVCKDVRALSVNICVKCRT